MVSPILSYRVLKFSDFFNFLLCRKSDRLRIYGLTNCTDIRDLTSIWVRLISNPISVVLECFEYIYIQKFGHAKNFADSKTRRNLKRKNYDWPTWLIMVFQHWYIIINHQFYYQRRFDGLDFSEFLSNHFLDLKRVNSNLDRPNSLTSKI